MKYLMLVLLAAVFALPAFAQTDILFVNDSNSFGPEQTIDYLTIVPFGDPPLTNLLAQSLNPGEAVELDLDLPAGWYDVNATDSASSIVWGTSYYIDGAAGVQLIWFSRLSGRNVTPDDPLDDNDDNAGCVASSTSSSLYFLLTGAGLFALLAYRSWERAKQ